MKILFLDIDTLRPDHMGCYGYPRNTTPAMDKIAQEGVRFTNCYCSDAPCLPSRAALVSGRFGIHNGAVGHGGTAADRRLTGESRSFTDAADTGNFFQIFRQEDMYTASISTFAERHSSWWFNAGFHETHNVGRRGMESGEQVLPVALDWIARNADREDWFLHLHFWDPHTPYRAPAEFGNPFEHEPLESWITPEVFAEHLRHVGPHSINELNMYHGRQDARYPRQPGHIAEYDELKRLFDGYDCGIRYTDDLIAQVFAALEAKGIFEEVAVIITSDHGENMGELGIYAEHATADHATCNIPLIVKWPGGRKNAVDDGLHYQIDMPPTMAELLQIEPNPKWDGKSYAKTLTEGADTGHESLVISQMAHVCQRSARLGDWLYIRTIHDGYHLLDDEMLFHLKDDPHQQHDRKAEYPELCAKGAKIILDWQERMMQTGESEIDPMWTVMREGGPFHTRGQLPAYLTQLENTGRAEGAKRLREKYHSGG